MHAERDRSGRRQRLGSGDLRGLGRALLQAREVDRIFGLQGGHIQPIWDHVARLGIRIVDVRDEGPRSTWRMPMPS